MKTYAYLVVSAVAIAISAPVQALDRMLVAKLEAKAESCGRIAGDIEAVLPGGRYKVLALVLTGADAQLTGRANLIEKESALKSVERAFERGETKPRKLKNEKERSDAIGACSRSFME